MDWLDDMTETIRKAHEVIKRKKKKKKFKVMKPKYQRHIAMKPYGPLPEIGNRGKYSTYSKALRGEE